jgi:hypothetical protein
MIGSVGAPTDYAAPGPRALTATDLGAGTMSAGDISLAAGTSGSDVVGVVYLSRTHGDVFATVSRGRSALWLPGGELKDYSSNGVEVEVTYRDGRTGTSRLNLNPQAGCSSARWSAPAFPGVPSAFLLGTRAAREALTNSGAGLWRAGIPGRGDRIRACCLFVPNHERGCRQRTLST